MNRYMVELAIGRDVTIQVEVEAELRSQALRRALDRIATMLVQGTRAECNGIRQMEAV